jgi:serine protein kinase
MFRHRFDGKLMTTSQKWGVVETTPNHSIYNRDGETFFPEENIHETRHQMMAVRALGEMFGGEAAPGTGAIDVFEGLDGLLDHTATATSSGGRITAPCEPGWVRLDRPRSATAMRSLYEPLKDVEPLEDLLTVLVWYATEGHVNGANGGIVISQADRAQLERVRECYSRISSASGSIDTGARTDSAWRLYLGAEIVARLAVHHCGQHSVNKRLPDFLFELPRPYLQRAFDELMQTDGTREVHDALRRVASDDYLERFFEYKTLSPVLAAQVGTLSTMLGYDYSVYRHDRGEDRAPSYRVRFVSGQGKKGGRHDRCETRMSVRPASDEWVYDIECVGLHNFVCGVGNVVCHNTNEAEYKKLLNNEFMEALRDRTVKVDIPYITRVSEEVKIYAKDYNAEAVGKHIAPHTLYVASLWGVLTRLEEPKKQNLSVLQKAKLYDGKLLPGFTQDNIKELRKEADREGLEGISPRYIQDKISNALVSDKGDGSINPFMVLNELESGLKSHSLISSEEQRQRYRDLLSVVKQEYEDIVKDEVRRAISADEDAISKLCANYIDNVKAYTQKEKVKNPYTGQDEEPDERLMRSIEEKIDIPESRKDDFRREIMNYIGALAVEGRQFDYKTNERLRKALESKLFEDQKDSIKLTSLVSNVVDRETQEKIDVVKQRLIKNFGYDEVSATDVLNFVASIFARGDVKE